MSRNVQAPSYQKISDLLKMIKQYKDEEIDQINQINDRLLYPPAETPSKYPLQRENYLQNPPSRFSSENRSKISSKQDERLQQQLMSPYLQQNKYRKYSPIQRKKQFSTLHKSKDYFDDNINKKFVHINQPLIDYERESILWPEKSMNLQKMYSPSMQERNLQVRARSEPRVLPKIPRTSFETREAVFSRANLNVPRFQSVAEAFDQKHLF